MWIHEVDRVLHEWMRGCWRAGQLEAKVEDIEIVLERTGITLFLSGE